MHRSYTLWWLFILVQVVAVETIAIMRRGPGDSLSEHVWKLLPGYPGALIFACIFWLIVHFAFGRGKPLDLADIAFALAGVVFWLVVRSQGRP